MPNEAIISRIEILLDEVVSLGGASERTGIVSGLIVVDSAPSSAALANHIIVRDSRDGNFISVLKTPGQTYANNDLVSVLFIEGTEPIALAQSPGSSSGNVKVSEVWESDFGAIAGEADASGDWTWHQNVILDGTSKAIKGTGSNTPDLGTSTDAEKFGNAYLAAIGFSDQVFEAAAWFDLALLDSANDSGISSHFRDNTATFPAGWTETDAAWDVNTNDPFSFFNITSHPTDTGFDYRIQGSWDLENDSAANAFNSWILGPMNYRPDDAWSGDTEFYFGIYRDNAGSIDTGTYVRVLLQFNNAGSIWRVRGEVRDGTTQTAGSWFTVPFPYVQPIFLRCVLRNDTNKNGRNYIGTGAARDPLSQYRVQLQNVGNTVTWGTVWARIHGSQPAGGANATWKLGALDFVSSASIG